MLGGEGYQDLSKGFRNIGSSVLDEWIKTASALSLSSAFFDGMEDFLFLKTMLAK